MGTEEIESLEQAKTEIDRWAREENAKLPADYQLSEAALQGVIRYAQTDIVDREERERLVSEKDKEGLTLDILINLAKKNLRSIFSGQQAKAEQNEAKAEQNEPKARIEQIASNIQKSLKSSEAGKSFTVGFFPSKNPRALSTLKFDLGYYIENTLPETYLQGKNLTQSDVTKVENTIRSFFETAYKQIEHSSPVKRGIEAVVGKGTFKIRTRGQIEDMENVIFPPDATHGAVPGAS